MMILPIKNFKVRSKANGAEVDYMVGKQRYRYQLNMTAAEVAELVAAIDEVNSRIDEGERPTFGDIVERYGLFAAVCFTYHRIIYKGFYREMLKNGFVESVQEWPNLKELTGRVSWERFYAHCLRYGINPTTFEIEEGALIDDEDLSMDFVRLVRTLKSCKDNVPYVTLNKFLLDIKNASSQPGRVGKRGENSR